jgi:hypothetical protein
MSAAADVAWFVVSGLPMVCVVVAARYYLLMHASARARTSGYFNVASRTFRAHGVLFVRVYLAAYQD